MISVYFRAFCAMPFKQWARGSNPRRVTSSEIPATVRFRLAAKTALWRGFLCFPPVNAPLVCGRRRRGAGPEPVLSGGGRFLMQQKYLEPPGFRYFCVETARENCKGPSPRLLFTNFVTKSVLIQYNIRLKPIFFRYNTHEVICYGREIYTALGRRCRR